MDKVFQVSLFNEKDGHDYYAELMLPATPYELLDALERLQFEEGDKISCDIEDYGRFHFLSPGMENKPNFLALNALAQRLALLDEDGQIAFDALVRIERDKGITSCPLERLVDLAYSTECCDVYPGVSNYGELGYHYVENDLVPSLKDIPEEDMVFIDYERIGKKISGEEGGVLISRGYVLQTEDLKEVFQTLDLTLRKPEYTILLGLTYGEEQTILKLPADPLTMDDALEHLGALGFGGVEIKCLDCAVPILIPTIGNEDNIAHINRLAGMIQEMEPGQLTKFKAVLTATGEHTVLGATDIAHSLDDYLFTPGLTSAYDVGLNFLESELGAYAAETLLPHVNLYGYGNTLLKEQKAEVTEYGLVSREGGQSLRHTMETVKHPEMGGMTMQ